VDAQKLADAQSALLQIGVAITSGLQMELVLRSILDQCRTVLPVDALYVALYDAAEQIYQVPLFWDQGDYRSLAPVDLRRQQSLTGIVIASKRTLYLEDLSDEATAAAYPGIKVADAPTRTYLGVPLLMRGEVVGVLSIQRLPPAGYTERHIRFLEMIAPQAAVAIENARLYEAARAELAERQRVQESLAASERRLRQANEELEQRVAERTAELRAVVDELQRANAGKDAFMAAVSHELRTPLTGILGMADMLQGQSRGPLNEYQERYVEVILASAARLQEMINSILSYTSVMVDDQPAVGEPCQLAELCAISTRSLRPRADQKGQQIEMEVTPAQLQIRSDGHAILHILNALLDNAVKFTPEGGRVGITARAAAQGSAVEVTVWDTGIGISADHIVYLFRPFTQFDQRLARRYHGLGLGLAYVKRQVELLGGAIAVESKEGEGSRFTVTLPVEARVAATS
jgi:signal transduction histidine kinase